MYVNNSFKVFLYFIIFMIIVFMNVQLKNKIKETQLFLLSLITGILLIILLNMIFRNTREAFNNSASNMTYSSMGAFDNLILKPDGDSKWRHSPSNLPLYKPSTLYTPQGTPLPLKKQAKITTLPFDSNAPSVDGSLKAPKNMFMFAYNQCRPECCPSTFSCDHGCVCTTEQQRKFIGEQRGNNKNYSVYPTI